MSPLENDYALVHDALPAGKMSRVRSTVRKKQDKGDGRYSLGHLVSEIRTSKQAAFIPASSLR